MNKEDITITYENNIFYCTKKGVQWVSVDGEKWYGEEKRITDLEKEVLEVRQHLELTEREWGKDTVKLFHFKTLFTRAKEIIALGLRVCETSSIEYMNLYQKQAEQFLKEIEK